MGIYQKYLALAMMGAMLAADNHRNTGYHEELTDEERLSILRARKLKTQSLLLKSGCKESTIDGITVIALNMKNAVRKVERAKAVMAE